MFGSLSGVFQRRLTLVVAGPGYGKSTILAAWGLAMGCAWYTASASDASPASLASGLAQALRRRVPALDDKLEGALATGGERNDPERSELLAGLISEALDPLGLSNLPLVIDAAEHLAGGGGSLRLIEALRRQAPPGLHLVLASRAALPVGDAGEGPAPVLTLGPRDLAFSLDETRELVTASLGPLPEEQLVDLHERWAGWPAAIRLGVEAILNDAKGGAGPSPGTPVPDLGASFSSLADDALRDEPPEALRLLSTMAAFERFTPALCEALGVAGARPVLDSLARRGLFVKVEGGADGWFALHALLGEYAADRWPLDPQQRREHLVSAAGWFSARGHLADALQALRRAGDPDALRTFLADHGERMLAEGQGSLVESAAELLPPDARDDGLESLLGWACRLRGDWKGAVEHYRRAAAGRDRLPGLLAWRLVEALYLQEDLESALEAAARADPEASSDHDRAMLLAWEASAHHRLGDNERAGELARAAIEIAERAGDDEALAAGHTALAMVVLLLGGDDATRDAHELAAIEAAERSGSVHAHVRILVNRSDGLVIQGRYAEVAALTDTALRRAESSGDPYTVARVLEARADAALGQGRLAEAVSDGRLARVLYERAGSQAAFGVSLLLGRAHREAEEPAASRAAYQEGLDAAQANRIASDLQEGLAGLARATAAEDPAEARKLAKRSLAVEGGTQHSRSEAALAAGWVELVAGDRGEAARLAKHAATLPVGKGRRPRLAEALELAGLASDEPDIRALTGALELWTDLGNELGTARVDLALALLDPDGDGRRRPHEVERRLQALGVHRTGRVAGLLAALPRPEAPAVEIQTLGGFAVLRSGLPVPFSEWKSKKARDLLKILVARRGLPTHREFLMEALWPEASPATVSNRLSVATAILRSVLDPGRSFGPQHFVTGEGESLRLNVDRLALDVTGFLGTAAEALEAGPATPEGLLALEAAEALYAGDFLEEDPYEDWATPLREEAKLVYVELCRALAAARLRAGMHDTAVRYGLKILARDRYDEVSHLLIVRALAASGRHGEARRRYRIMVSALDEIGIAPAAYPSSG